MKSQNTVSRGVWNTISNSYVIECLADKFDFVILDLEHGFRDFSECESQVRFLLNSKSSLFVRLRSFEDDWVQSLLDLGVSRFLIPQIRSINEVKEFISKVNFPPRGRRGFHPKSTNLLRQPELAWGTTTIPKIEVFPIVETIESLRLLEDLLSLEGVTGTYFGSYDLSIEISNGDRESIEIQAAFQKLTKLSNENKRIVICLSTNDVSEQLLIDNGIRYIVKGIDSQLINDAFEAGAKKIER